MEAAPFDTLLRMLAVTSMTTGDSFMPRVLLYVRFQAYHTVRSYDGVVGDARR